MSTSRAFRFGLATTNAIAGRREWIDLARRAESLGYSSLHIGDHFVGYEPPSMQALAFAAAATETLRVGTLVLGNDYRHPAVLAKDAATLDLLSEGRLEFGIGSGWLRADYDALGLPYDSPGRRIERLAESLAIIKSCWTGEPFDFSGQDYTIQDYTGSPLPAQRPGPPICIGGGGRRILGLAGREAEIVGIHVSMHAGEVTPQLLRDGQDDQIREKIEWVQRGAGERFGEIELQMQCFAGIGTDRNQAIAPIAAALNTSVEECLASALTLAGDVDRICEELTRRREAWGISYFVVQAELCDEFAPVVERLGSASSKADA